MYKFKKNSINIIKYFLSIFLLYSNSSYCKSIESGINGIDNISFKAIEDFKELPLLITPKLVYANPRRIGIQLQEVGLNDINLSQTMRKITPQSFPILKLNSEEIDFKTQTLYLKYSDSHDPKNDLKIKITDPDNIKDALVYSEPIYLDKLEPKSLGYRLLKLFGLADKKKWRYYSSEKLKINSGVIRSNDFIKIGEGYFLSKEFENLDINNSPIMKYRYSIPNNWALTVSAKIRVNNRLDFNKKIITTGIYYNDVNNAVLIDWKNELTKVNQDINKGYIEEIIIHAFPIAHAQKNIKQNLNLGSLSFYESKQSDGFFLIPALSGNTEINIFTYIKNVLSYPSNFILRQVEILSSSETKEIKTKKVKLEFISDYSELIPKVFIEDPNLLNLLSYQDLNYVLDRKKFISTKTIYSLPIDNRSLKNNAQSTFLFPKNNILRTSNGDYKYAVINYLCSDYKNPLAALRITYVDGFGKKSYSNKIVKPSTPISLASDYGEIFEFKLGIGEESKCELIDISLKSLDILSSYKAKPLSLNISSYSDFLLENTRNRIGRVAGNGSGPYKLYEFIYPKLQKEFDVNISYSILNDNNSDLVYYLIAEGGSEFNTYIMNNKEKLQFNLPALNKISIYVESLSGKKNDNISLDNLVVKIADNYHKEVRNVEELTLSTVMKGGFFWVLQSNFKADHFYRLSLVDSEFFELNLTSENLNKTTTKINKVSSKKINNLIFYILMAACIFLFIYLYFYKKESISKSILLIEKFMRNRKIFWFIFIAFIIVNSFVYLISDKSFKLGIASVGMVLIFAFFVKYYLRIYFTSLRFLNKSVSTPYFLMALILIFSSFLFNAIGKVNATNFILTISYFLCFFGVILECSKVFKYLFRDNKL
jgi:hypothetical protein